MVTIEEVLERTKSITLKCGPKRMVENGIRDFYLRYTWEVSLVEDGRIIESEWEGFASAKECVADLLNNCILEEAVVK